MNKYNLKDFDFFKIKVFFKLYKYYIIEISNKNIINGGKI